ncbi:MAG TPA: hypothetical protein VFU15_07310 [Bacteroidia bacterium]|nr:hypothetical protein [Bacteroidia bacterium]
MKKIYTAFLALVIAGGLSAQAPANQKSPQNNSGSGGTTTDDNQPSNCYTKWEKIFEERGAEDVKDGVYDDVIITVRKGADASCYSGKVEVKDGKIINMYRKLSDGTYELYKPKLQFEKPMTIVNGISVSLLTVDDELVNVIFPKTLKPKKADYTNAPDPPGD